MSNTMGATSRVKVGFAFAEGTASLPEALGAEAEDGASAVAVADEVSDPHPGAHARDAAMR